MKLLTREENFEYFKKKIRELGGDWAREDRIRFRNYPWGAEEKIFQGNATMTNLYADNNDWDRAENSYAIHVEINNTTQRIIIRFHKDQSWRNVEYFENFKNLKKYLEENNCLQMRITNKYKQGFYY